MQSIATAAGYMTAPMISSLAALYDGDADHCSHASDHAVDYRLAILGCFLAFPLKKRFINDEQHPFPEGRAAGIVMDALHTSDALSGMLKARLLVIFGGAAALIEVLKHGANPGETLYRFLTIPDRLEAGLLHVVNWDPKVRGVPLDQLTVSIEPDHVMFGAGGLMGIRTGCR